MTTLIPAHDCMNCGDRCGLIPANKKEIKKIKRYIVKNKVVPNASGYTCPFRDEKLQRCNIYPARPILCKLMGVVKGMKCKHGNSHEIDGSKFLEKETCDHEVMNFMDWTA